MTAAKLSGCRRRLDADFCGTNDSGDDIKMGCGMAQVLIRNVDDEVVAALRARASARGRSLEAELRDLLARAATHPRADLAAEFAQVREMTPAGPRRLAEDLIREGRDEH